MIREGAHASYVGPGRDGVEVGDRCIVLAAEAHYSNVRWLTGAKVGSYEAIRNQHLAADRRTSVSAFDTDDEFGFEADPPHSVRVASAAVYASGGDTALLRALEHDGVLDRTRDAVSSAVATIRTALRQDPVWIEVVSELGDQCAPQFVDFVVRNMVLSALREVDDGSQES